MFVFLFRFLIFEQSILRNYFGMLGVLCTINCYSEYRIRILCICLYMGTYVKDLFITFLLKRYQTMSEKCEQLSYEVSF